MTPRPASQPREHWELIELDLTVHVVRPKAVLVSADGNRSGAVWLPRSMIHLSEEPESGVVQTVRLTQQLAEERGLV